MLVDLDYEIVYQGRTYGPGRDIEMPDDCVALTILRTPAREVERRDDTTSPALNEGFARQDKQQLLLV